MKEDKELIDVIVDQLRQAKEPPYKVGAWEKFKAENNSAGATLYSMRRIWYAAASVLLLMGLATAWFMSGESNITGDKIVQHTSEEPENGKQDSKPLVEAGSPETAFVDKYHQSDLTADPSSRDNVPLDEYEFRLSSRYYKHEGLGLMQARSGIEMTEAVHIPHMLPLQSRSVSLGYSSAEQPIEDFPAQEFDRHLASLSAVQGKVLAMKEVEPYAQSQRIRLSDRFELGVFVSPYATSQKMDVGGGLSLSYKLAKRLSIRTGASYNNYEVNTLKNPVEESSTETVVEKNVAGRNAIAMEATGAAAYQNMLIVPNVNAIKGFVQSIDIPVELKFNVDRSIYAAAGVSYSAILNQQRNAYYIENVNVETFADGYPENKEQAEQAMKPVTKTIESTENNVNPNGFSGFVNFSIGKDIRVNKTMGVSLEPYLKIPVGQYRRADMDYTNGGIRIITRF